MLIGLVLGTLGNLVDCRRPGREKPHPAEIDPFGPALRAKRECRNLTTAELGERAGLDTGLIERIEDGKHDTYLTEIVAVARAFDMSAAELVALTE